MPLSPRPNVLPPALKTPAPSAVFEIQPLEDERWDEFVSHSANSSVFHTRAWLEALRKTYKYDIVAFTTAPAGHRLEDCLVFSRVASWLTGTRLVSLPFSDHCAPLCEDPKSLQPLFTAAEHQVVGCKLNYLELRTNSALPLFSSLPRSDQFYCFHQLDLTRELDVLFQGFHKSCAQRKIRRAERERLTYEEGRSDAFIETFYRLFLMTRRRHQAPPQPKEWFQNLANSFGDRFRIHVASADSRPAAAIVTLRHKDTLVYKYGGSDQRFHSLGPMHLVFWRCIQQAKCDNLRIFDLGRSNLADDGLIAFKDRWGSVRSTLTYSRYGIPGRFEYRPNRIRRERIARDLVSRLPQPLFAAVGRYLYRHIG